MLKELSWLFYVHHLDLPVNFLVVSFNMFFCSLCFLQIEVSSRTLTWAQLLLARILCRWCFVCESVRKCPVSGVSRIIVLRLSRGLRGSSNIFELHGQNGKVLYVSI